MAKRELEPWQQEDIARLREIFERSGMTQEQFAQDYGIGTTQAAVGHYLCGRNALNLENAIKFATGLGCGVADFSPRLAAVLAEGVGHGAQARRPEISGVITMTGAYTVILRPWPDAAPGHLDLMSYTPGAHGLQVGDGMAPRYRAGELLILAPSATPNPGDDVLIVAQSATYLGEWLYERQGRITLGAINGGHANTTVPREEIESMSSILAVVSPSLRMA